MLSIQKKLKETMEKIKKQNPDANWANLLTGIAILIMVAVFSVWYFSNSESVIIGNSVQEEEQETNVAMSDTSEAMEKQEDNSVSTGSMESSKPVGEIEVMAGEGLWQVAERACGDGEKYVILAQANGLNEWSELVPGQRLKVACEFK